MNEENHGAVFEAMSVARFGAEDEARAKWLAEQIAKEPGWGPRALTCPHGHPLDGVRHRKNRTERYCKTCNREWQRKARANKAGTGPAKEGANG